MLTFIYTTNSELEKTSIRKYLTIHYSGILQISDLVHLQRSE